MPNIKSKSQLRLMEAIIHGAAPQGGKKISKATAKEVVGDVPKGYYKKKNLPERVGKKGK